MQTYRGVSAVIGLAATSFFGCSNTVVIEGGSGGQGGSSSTHANGSVTVTHAVSNTSVTVGQTSSQVSSTQVGPSVGSTAVVSASGVTVSTVSTSISVASSVASTVATSAQSSGSGGAPPEWTCASAFYAANDGCDCGCGIIDPDCPDITGAQCAFCSDFGSCSTDNGCPGFIDPNDNAHCTGPVPEVCGNGLDDDQDTLTDCADPDCAGQPGCPPPGWTCAIAFWGSHDGCDCGCGVVDPDCATITVQSCQFCGDGGSCSTVGCPGNINPMQNNLCN